MNDEFKSAGDAAEDLPRPELTRRIAWIAVQLILVYCLADEFQPFFYQAF